MGSLLRPANFLLLFTYLALSATPFLPLLLGRPVENAGRMLVTECAAWLAVWAVFRRPSWFHWLLLPAFLALPFEAYLQVYYAQGISSHHLGIVAETSPAEALEFLGNKAWLLLALALGGISVWWLGWVAARKTRALDWAHGSRWVTIALMIVGVGAWPEQHDAIEAPMTAPAPAATKLSAWAGAALDPTAFAGTWPFGLAVRGHEFWKERRHLAELAQASEQFSFGARQGGAALDMPQLVVMVIGESSRYDRWSLNGYRRETNPLLKQEANLVSLSNVVTAVSATRLSIPVLVSRKPAIQSLQSGFSEKSFLTAFREAGYKTWWLSNQMSFGQFDTPVSVFAKEAEVTQFMNAGGFKGRSNYDDVLLAPLAKAIEDPARKKLIVLHTLGSHWNYNHRHPQAFDKWQPSLSGMENPPHTDAALKTPLNNSYDNSILYTDWFLAQVIASLKSSKQMASMMYVSDHGQTLYDGSCKLAFHGHNTQYDFHVPALVWYSDLYRQTHPEKVAQLRRNKRARLATENFFHSLLDMADIRYGSEQLEWSFVNRKFIQHKRYVDSYGWADYDNATFRGDCREVIDRGTPLARK